MMGTATKYKDFAALLKRRGISFKEREHWLTVGKPDTCNKWILYLSCCVHNSDQLIETVLPVLQAHKVPFKVLKNQHCVLLNNWGELVDENEACKVVSIYPSTEPEAILLVGEIEAITTDFNGQVIPGYLRVGKVVYACYSQLIASQEAKEESTLLLIPKKSKIPFVIDRKYKPKSKWVLIWSMIRRGYIPIKLIRSHIKGKVFKGANLRNLSNWCLIKWGFAYAAGDIYGRTIKDRFLLQQEKLQALFGVVSIPRFIDYYEQYGDACLVVDFIDGMELEKTIRELLNGRNWKGATEAVRRKIIGYYKQVLEIVQSLHAQGEVYRDVTQTNFIITLTGKVVIVDPELCYSLITGKPNPPFMSGTKGYYSFEQVTDLRPDYQQDIYSLGALLIFFLTGENPNDLIEKGINATRRTLLDRTGNPALVETVTKCIERNPARRPALEELIQRMSDQAEVIVLSNDSYKKAM